MLTFCLVSFSIFTKSICSLSILHKCQSSLHKYILSCTCSQFSGHSFFSCLKKRHSVCKHKSVKKNNYSSQTSIKLVKEQTSINRSIEQKIEKEIDPSKYTQLHCCVTQGAQPAQPTWMGCGEGWERGSRGRLCASSVMFDSLGPP